MRLPFVASATETLAGATGQASPNSVDSVSVASGIGSPILIMEGLFRLGCGARAYPIGRLVHVGEALGRLAHVGRELRPGDLPLEPGLHEAREQGVGLE